MAGSNAERRSAAAWRLVRSQHGVVAREQLLALGFTKSAIEHRLQTGRLHLIARGIYAVGRAQVDREGRWMAAVLACGPGAALSHRSAAALWGFAKEHPDYIDVSLRCTSEARLIGLRCHRRPALAASEITIRQGTPLTQPVQTFLDLVAVLGPRDLERAINEADKLDVIDADALRKALDEHASTNPPTCEPSSVKRQRTCAAPCTLTKQVRVQGAAPGGPRSSPLRDSGPYGGPKCGRASWRSENRAAAPRPVRVSPR